MHGFKGERVLMRIHIGERDRHDGNPLHQEIVGLLRKRGYAGAEDRIRAILPELDGMITGGMITLERAKVIMYRPHRSEEETPDDWSIDLTGSWQVPGPPGGA